jgi:amphi-Trp domain-containing protein
VEWQHDGMHIYEDARTVSRADLAAWLRQLANQLESGAQIFYGAAGAVTVADQVRCELEIERDGDAELSVEIEFSWVNPKAAEPASTSSQPDGADAEEDDAEETEPTAETAASHDPEPTEQA